MNVSRYFFRRGLKPYGPVISLEVTERSYLFLYGSEWRYKFPIFLQFMTGLTLLDVVFNGFAHAVHQ